MREGIGTEYKTRQKNNLFSWVCVPPGFVTNPIGFPHMLVQPTSKAQILGFFLNVFLHQVQANKRLPWSKLPKQMPPRLACEISPSMMRICYSPVSNSQPWTVCFRAFFPPISVSLQGNLKYVNFSGKFYFEPKEQPGWWVGLEI